LLVILLVGIFLTDDKLRAYIKGLFDMAKKRHNLRYTVSFLFSILFFLLVAPAANVSAISVDDENFEELLEQLRQEFFAPERGITTFAEPIQVIYSEYEFEHMSPPDISQYLIPMDDNYASLAPLFAPRPYTVGSRRQFNAFRKNPTFGHWGELVRQGTHVNIWILDDVQNRPSAANLNQAIAMFDDITFRMTRDFAPFRGVRVITPYGNMPVVGDIHGDGRVNVLLHEGFGGGYFWSRNFMTDDGNAPIAIFHMNPNALLSSSLFAHELQHLLFYMHFGVYAHAAGQHQDFLWLNEALSMLAGVHWAEAGRQHISLGWFFESAPNSYSNPPDGRRGDFINFNNSLKNYSMSELHGLFMHRVSNGNYATAMYNFFRSNFPTATNRDQFEANALRLMSMSKPQITGNAFHAAGLTGSTGASGELAFNLLYFLFMENFAADGGNIISGNTVHPTQPFHSNEFSVFNLWGIRPNLGIPHGTGGVWGNHGVFENANHGGFCLRSFEALPVLQSGGHILLVGYMGA